MCAVGTEPLGAHPEYRWAQCESSELAAAHLLVVAPSSGIRPLLKGRPIILEHEGQIAQLAADLATALIVPSGIATDFDDVARVLGAGGRPAIAVARESGMGRSPLALMRALDKAGMAAERYLLLLIFGPGKFALDEIRTAMNAVRDKVDACAFVVYGVGTDARLPAGAVRATVIAS